jgi:hypothetical protein
VITDAHGEEGVSVAIDNNVARSSARIVGSIAEGTWKAATTVLDSRTFSLNLWLGDNCPGEILDFDLNVGELLFRGKGDIANDGASSLTVKLVLGLSNLPPSPSSSIPELAHTADVAGEDDDKRLRSFGDDDEKDLCDIGTKFSSFWELNLGYGISDRNAYFVERGGDMPNAAGDEAVGDCRCAYGGTKGEAPVAGVHAVAFAELGVSEDDRLSRLSKMCPSTGTSKFSFLFVPINGGDDDGLVISALTGVFNIGVISGDTAFGDLIAPNGLFIVDTASSLSSSNSGL